MLVTSGINAKSCIIDEIKLKILTKEGKHASKSVFFKDSTKEARDGSRPKRKQQNTLSQLMNSNPM